MPRARESEVAVIRPPQPRSSLRAVAGAAERRLQGAIEVPIEQVVADPDQPRRDWGYNDGGARLRELAESVREFGILQPLVVREEGTTPDGRQRYIIISGARRRAAAEQAGLATLPVVVRGEESSRVRVLQLIENLQRQDLSPLDEARAYQELMEVEGLTPPQLADRLHVSAQHVRDRLRILSDQVLADAVERKQISATVARDIKQLPDDVASEFRRRIRSGERVETSHVAEMRGRLAAAGVVNPRRKLPKVRTEAERDKEGERPEEQTTFVNPRPDGGHAAGRRVDITSGVSDLETRKESDRDPREQTTFVPGTSPVAVRVPEPVVSTGAAEDEEIAMKVARLIASAVSDDARDELGGLLLEVRTSGHPLRVWQHVLDRLLDLIRPSRGVP